MGNTGWLGMKEAAGSRGPGGGGRWMLDAERGITTMDDGEKGGCWQECGGMLRFVDHGLTSLSSSHPESDSQFANRNAARRCLSSLEGRGSRV